MNGFISYSHIDYQDFRAFKRHLRAVERAFDIDFWSDSRINAGYHWDAAIRREIDRAEVFVLLLSPGFIASDYIFDGELPAIMERKRLAATLVLPVVLQRCFWQMVCSALQAVPTVDGQPKPAADWRPRANGFN